MEVEEGHLGDAADEEASERGSVKELSPPKKKWASSDAVQPTSGGCFDCNICLEFAVEPVVTLCGHLYCWPCIYKWLQLEYPTPQPCPVCKATLSQATLVPLYGRGHNNSNNNKGSSQSSLEIPRRPIPSVHRDNSATASVAESESPAPVQQNQQQVLQRGGGGGHNGRRQHTVGGGFGPSASSVATSLFHPLLGGNAIAVLPWVLGNHGGGGGDGLYYSNPYYLIGSGTCPRLRRQEMQARRSLHRVSIFLFCCLVLCLLLF